MRVLVLSLWLSLATTAAAACRDGGAPAHGDEAPACATSGRGDTYVAGLERRGKAGLLDVKLLSADPAPPGFHTNTWIIQVDSMASGAAGAPVTGATITVTPFMPDHQHGAAIKAKVEPLPDAGRYKLSPINLWMPGYWETTIDVQSGTVRDSVVYRFCIQA